MKKSKENQSIKNLLKNNNKNKIIIKVLPC